MHDIKFHLRSSITFSGNVLCASCEGRAERCRPRPCRLLIGQRLRERCGGCARGARGPCSAALRLLSGTLIRCSRETPPVSARSLSRSNSHVSRRYVNAHRWTLSAVRSSAWTRREASPWKARRDAVHTENENFGIDMRNPERHDQHRVPALRGLGHQLRGQQRAES